MDGKDFVRKGRMKITCDEVMLGSVKVTKDERESGGVR